MVGVPSLPAPAPHPRRLPSQLVLSLSSSPELTVVVLRIWPALSIVLIPGLCQHPQPLCVVFSVWFL